MSIKFSILIACKNEQEDIRLALDSSVNQNYGNKEILVVDDSSDRTKEIIREYEGIGVHLIDGKGEGCCRARNLGIESATGEVIVFLTADTKLKPDYLKRLVDYYENGVDWVTTKSHSYNLESVYSRFVECMHLRDTLHSSFAPLTSAGYSVRRSAALEVGMISGGVYPFNTCRDWSLGRKLSEKGYKKIHDDSLVVPHKSPDDFSEFWTVRKTRGLMSSYQPLFMYNQNKYYKLAIIIARVFQTVIILGLFFPAYWKVISIARHSNRFVLDSFFMTYTYYLDKIAFCCGEIQGFKKSLPHLATRPPVIVPEIEK